MSTVQMYINLYALCNGQVKYHTISYPISMAMGTHSPHMRIYDL